MTRRAAGRPGGRAAADGPRTGTRGRRPRTLGALAARLLTAGLVLAGSTALAPPAHAAPLPGGPVLAAPADDDTGRPVRIDVGRLEPRTLTPGAEITVTGTLTNTGTEVIDHLAVRLQRGERLTSREQVAAASDAATTVTAPFRDVEGSLQPGDTLPFAYAVPATALRIGRDGVYPLLLNVNGTVGGQQHRVGELATFVVQQPVAPAARVTVGWLWPLVDRIHRSPSGGFVDDDLAASVAEDGRLDRALAVIERLPTTVPTGGGDRVPVVPVTLAIDPALIEELTTMAAGPYAVDGVAGAGQGTDAAAAFLERLRAVAAVQPIVALPYGDVDADSLLAVGLGDVLARSLPATGTAQAAAPEQPAPTAAPTSAPPPADETRPGAGAEILADALGVEPRTDLAWAAGGSFRTDTVATLQQGGIDGLVLGPGGLTDGGRAIGADGGAAAARSTVRTAAGDVGVLVADQTLGEVVGGAERAAGGPRIAEQRYLAELALLSQQAPGTEQTVLVAPPRRIDAGLEGAGAMLSDAAGTSWLRPGTLEDLLAGPAASTGELADPVDAVRLDAAGLARVARAVAARDALAGSVAGEPDVVLRTYDAATSRTTSVAWRDDVEGFRIAAQDLDRSMQRLLGKVTLLAPADGTYSLASSDSPLVLTVSNDLPFAVTVLLDVRTKGNRGLDIGNIGPQVLPPLQRTTLTVPTHVRQSGGFAVTARLTTPGGAPLGEPVTIQVKSTAYGWISLGITFGAAALLALLFLRRLIRFLLRRRRSPGGEGLTPAPEGAAVPLPPTRSPV